MLSINKNVRQYFKFDLSQNLFTDIAYYNENLAFKRSEGKLEAIKHPNHTFRIKARHAVAYIKKKWTLWYLAKSFKQLEKCNAAIKRNPVWAHNYVKKGKILYEIGRSLDAIECFNKAIKFDPN